MLKCTICQQPIVLIPSAQERAKKFGGSAKDYEGLFTQHPECAIHQGNQGATALVKTIKSRQPETVVLSRFTIENGKRVYTTV